MVQHFQHLESHQALYKDYLAFAVLFNLAVRKCIRAHGANALCLRGNSLVNKASQQGISANQPDRSISRRHLSNSARHLGNPARHLSISPTSSNKSAIERHLSTSGRFVDALQPIARDFMRFKTRSLPS